jgi:hypothetical protein
VSWSEIHQTARLNLAGREGNESKKEEQILKYWGRDVIFPGGESFSDQNLDSGVSFKKLRIGKPTWGRICTSMTSWFSSESSGMETVVSQVVFSRGPLELAGNRDYTRR